MSPHTSAPSPTPAAPHCASPTASRTSRAWGRSLRALSVALATALLPAPACSGGASQFTIPEAALAPGGVFIAYVNGCEKGCDQLGRGDLIKSIDGKPTSTTADLVAGGYMDGQPHKLSVQKFDAKGAGANVEVELVAKAYDKIPPISDAPPFWTASAEVLNRAPTWARRRLFGRAIPAIMMFGSDGGLVTGRSLYGKKRFIVLFDWQTTEEQAIMGVFLWILQKAKTDLESKGYAVAVGQLKFPGRDREPMNDTDLRKWMSDNQLPAAQGGPLALPTTYRFPNKMEYQPANDVGLEGSTTMIEYLGQSPAIIIIDERGVVGWHSEATTSDPGGSGEGDADQRRVADSQYTIVEAINFALSL